MKKFLYVIGVGLVVGAVATAICMLLNNKKQKKSNVCYYSKEAENQKAPAKDTPLAYTNVVEEEPRQEDIKRSVIGSIYARHESAASIIKESVGTIHENIKASQNANNEIDQVSAELDKMLRED